MPPVRIIPAGAARVASLVAAISVLRLALFALIHDRMADQILVGEIFSAGESFSLSLLLPRKEQIRVVIGAFTSRHSFGDAELFKLPAFLLPSVLCFLHGGGILVKILSI